MKITLCALCLLATAAMLSSAAYADEPGRPLQACNDDAHKLCGDIKPGEGRIIDCLKDHYKEVSDGCYAVLQKIQTHKNAHDENGAAPPPEDNKGAPPPHGGNDDEQQPDSPPPD